MTLNINEERERLVDLIIQALFKGCEKSGAIEVVFSTLRVSLPRLQGMERGHWDPYDEFKEALSDFDELFGVTNEKGQNIANMRLALMAYCHIIESDPPYVLLANILRCAAGKRFHLNPYGFIQAKIKKRLKKKGEPDKIFDPESPPLPVSQKFKHLKELAKEAGFQEIGEAIDTFYDKDIRNAFSHANYIFTDEKFRYFVNEMPREIGLEELKEKISYSFCFMTALFIAVNSFLHQYSKMDKFHKLPNYEVLELICSEEELTGFKIHFSNGANAKFVRQSNGAYEAMNLMPNKDGTLNFFADALWLMKDEHLIDGQPYDEVVKAAA